MIRRIIGVRQNASGCARVYRNDSECIAMIQNRDDPECIATLMTEVTMTSAKLLLRLLLSTPLLLASATSCVAPPAAKPTARMIDFGIVRLVGPLDRHVDQKTATGFRSSGPGRSVFEKRTTEIPAIQGAAFGIRYRIVGSPGKPVTVEEIIRHPPMTRPDGTVIREERTKDHVTPDDGVVDQKFLYLLREPYEVVPGDWSLAVAIDGTTAIEQHFTIIPAKRS